jgi:S1-C subfamily serine protease
MHPCVVRVEVTKRTYDFDAPWFVNVERTPTFGSGVIITPGQILTTANVVADAVSIQVMRPGVGERAEARVVAIDHDRDLALLELITRAELFGSIAPVELGALPAVGTALEMIGFADREASGSLLRGTVARFDVVRYAHAQSHVPALAVDVGIGNHHEAGPAFVDAKLIGLAHQKPTDVETMCELVPTPVIAAFLEGAKRGPRGAVPTLGIRTQNLEPAHLRAQFGQDKGVLVIDVAHGESADGVLRRDDVVVAIGGRPINRAGTLELFGTSLRHDAVLALHHPGDRLRIDFVRDRQPQTAELTLTPRQPLVPRSRYEQPPSYLIYAGFVFETLTRNYLETWDTWWNKAPKEFLYYYYLGRSTPAQREVVMLASIFPDEMTRGYEQLCTEAVSSIDGHPPRDMSDFAARVASATGTIRIETTSGGVILLEVAEARRATKRICEAYEIPSDRTAGLPS